MEHARKAGLDMTKGYSRMGAEIESHVTPAYQELIDREKELVNAKGEVEKAIGSEKQAMMDMTKAELEQQMAAKGTLDNLKKLRAEYGVTTEALYVYAKGAPKEMEKVNKEAGAMAEKFGLSKDTVLLACNAMNISIKEFGDIHEKSIKRAEDAVAKFSDSTTSGFNKIKQNATISLTEYINTLKENAKATEQWSTNMNKLMKAGVSEGIIKELQGMGVQGAAQAQRFVDELKKLNGGAELELGKLTPAAAAKLKELETQFGVSFKAIGMAADTELSASDYTKKTKKVIQDMINGIVNKSPELKAAATALLNELDKQVDAGLEAGQFDTKTKNMILDMIRGIASQHPNMKAACDELIKTIENSTKTDLTQNGSTAGQTYNDGLSSKNATIGMTANGIKETTRQGTKVNLYDIGSNGGTTFADGINSQSGNVRSKARGLAETARDATSGISLYQNGQNIGIGFANGIWGSLGEVERAAQAIANAPGSRTRKVNVIASPSKLFKKYGKNLNEGMALGITDNIGLVDKATDKMNKAIEPKQIDFNSKINKAFGNSKILNNTNLPNISSKPAIFNLSIGGQVFKAFVNNITNAQEAELKLSSAY